MVLVVLAWSSWATCSFSACGLGPGVKGLGHQTPTPGMEAQGIVGKSTPPSVKQLGLGGGLVVLVICLKRISEGLIKGPLSFSRVCLALRVNPREML